MCSVVHAAEALRVDVRVDLRGRERAVAEELLDRPQVGSALEEMSRERMAELMWMRTESPEGARVEPAAARGEEERVRRAGRELRSGIAEVTGEPGCGLLAERDDSLLAALAADSHELLLEVDVGEVEVDRLPAPEPGGVHELHERAVPERERRVPAQRIRALESDIGARLVFRSGRSVQPTEAARAILTRARLLLGEARDLKSIASSRELSGDRRGLELPRARAAELGGVLRQHPHVDVVEACASPGEPRRELRQIRPVGAPSLVRVSRCGEEPLEGGVGVHG